MKVEPNIDAKAFKSEQDLKSSAMPFFSRFLEEQVCEEMSEKELEQISGGRASRTLKYPSDSDDFSAL
ncbi:MAG: microviridin/marinostatin family tricyclic proteinase inhibitor [Nostoc sp. S4]|nr:microviridin/marinostatin family tricyclic proteinase inhibitor [Nostoc sp. S4]